MLLAYKRQKSKWKIDGDNLASATYYPNCDNYSLMKILKNAKLLFIVKHKDCTNIIKVAD